MGSGGTQTLWPPENWLTDSTIAYANVVDSVNLVKSQSLGCMLVQPTRYFNRYFNTSHCLSWIPAFAGMTSDDSYDVSK